MESVGLNLLGRELRAYLFARMCLPPPPNPARPFLSGEDRVGAGADACQLTEKCVSAYFSVAPQHPSTSGGLYKEPAAAPGLEPELPTLFSQFSFSFSFSFSSCFL